MLTVILCALLALLYIALFYIRGKAFLSLIHADAFASESVLFGFIVTHIAYQALYLPFFFARGSYRLLTILWLVASCAITLLCLRYDIKKGLFAVKRRCSPPLLAALMGVIAFIGWLAIHIGLHAREYGFDTNAYITLMNRMVHLDSIMQRSGAMNTHNGFNSFFALFVTPSLITGIHPYHIALFMLRFLLVALTAMTAYRTGRVLFGRPDRGVCPYGLALAVIVPLAMTFWDSPYTAEFFWLRSNESKAFCQHVLLPLGFSVFLEALLTRTDRRVVWRKQLAIALAAMPVAASSLTTYLLLVFVGTGAVLVSDRFRDAKFTLSRALLCALPNIVYLVLHIVY